MKRTYPLGDRPAGMTYSEYQEARAVWTGERRPPRPGEWYISGAIPTVERSLAAAGYRIVKEAAPMP